MQTSQSNIKKWKRVRAKIHPDPEPTICPHCKRNMVYGGFAICWQCFEPQRLKLIKEEGPN